MSENRYDAIVIGSGMGGLSCAAFLAKAAGKRVLLVERHTVLGGFTHEFSRKRKYHWSTGFHYVGQMQPGHAYRRLMDYICDGKVTFSPLPAEYDQFVFPDLSFKVPKGAAAYEKRLSDAFPSEREAIARYFRDLKNATAYMVLYVAKTSIPPFARPFALMSVRGHEKLALTTVREYLDTNFRDPKLKAVLVAQMGNIGAPPATCSFGLHAIITTHYFEGGFVVSGGSKRLAEAIAPVIERAGGKCLTGREVKRILVENGKAKGIEVEDRDGSKTYFADTVISSTGFENTFGKLLAEKDAPGMRAKIADLVTSAPGFSYAVVYFGLKESPRTLGATGANMWLHANYDDMSELGMPKTLAANSPRFTYVSFPSVNDPESKSHTVEALIPCDYEFFKAWADQPCMKRDAAYKELKERLAAIVEKAVEKNLPGFSSLVDYREVSTSLTVEHYNNRARGDIYGLLCTPKRLKADWIRPKTAVRGLYMTGQDVATHGIVAALIAGMVTAVNVLGLFGMPRIILSMVRDALGRGGKAPTVTTKDGDRGDQAAA